MFGVILKATNISFQKCMTFCRSIYVKKVMKLLAFIFEQPSYNFIQILKLHYVGKKSTQPDQTPRSVASDLVLHCLALPHK